MVFASGRNIECCIIFKSGTYQTQHQYYLDSRITMKDDNKAKKTL